MHKKFHLQVLKRIKLSVNVPHASKLQGEYALYQGKITGNKSNPQDCCK